MHRSVTGGGLILFVAVTLGLSAPATAEAQDLAQLFIEPLDANGEVISGLGVDDFIVQEDDTPVTIVSADRVGPMKIALLIDNGQQMSEMNALNSLRAGMDGFFDTLGPEHEVSLFTIGRNIQHRVDFTTDRDELKDSAGSIFLDQGAASIMLDGIRETWERRYEETDVFPVMMMVLTDGTENSSNYSDPEYLALMQTLIDNGVTVNILQLSSRGGSVMSQYALNFTENTGGIYESIAAASGLAQWLPTFAERLNAHHAEMSKRYRLRYEPPDPRGAAIAAGARGAQDIRLFASLRVEEPEQ
ncbi:MAG: hypothetical protein F4Y45_16135 [Acidobacteria bacterium]|nr:hypothetical protein [Acidobacteriota bacterium]MXZ71815.1 hypothetical protein [Acidobacteriota bacterium]MYJ04183.1 hypothetical protein [Acidobacteriota bacterium]